MTTVAVSHYSDIFCVWAYVAQARIDQLEASFGEQVRLDYHFFSVFGSIRQKIERTWAERGGVAAYAQHVRGVGERFAHLELHPEVWRRTVPESSLPCHAFLAAVLLSHQDGDEGHRRVALAARKMRQAFFCECRDISLRSTQLEIAEALDLPRDAIEASLDSGRAFAVLHDDVEMARERGIHVSPTLLFNEGRQTLAGNVGYRVIEANVRELLTSPPHHDLPSWC